MILAFNATQRLIDAANKTTLAPAFKVLKGLIHAVQDAAMAREEVLELIKYCVGISRCVLATAKQDQIPSHIVMKLGEFKSEMEAIMRFVGAFDGQRGCCRKLTFGSRHRATVAMHKSNLEDILKAVMVSFVADSHGSVNQICKMIEDRDPPYLSALTDIPRAAPILPKIYVERTALREGAICGLVDEQRNATDTVCLWGMGGGGKTILASSIVRDDRVRSSFRQGIFWLHIGHKGKVNAALILEQLALELAVGPTNTPLHCPKTFDSADEAARHLSATIKSKTLRCLVVLDSVCDVEVVNTFASTGFHVLVTTRDRTVISPKHCGVMMVVGDMEEEKGLELLRKASDAHGPLPIEAKQVAGDCSMLPLALGMAGAMAKGNPLDAVSWRTVHQNLQLQGIKLMEMRSGELTSSESKSIFSTMHTSVEDLPNTVRKQLLLMAVMASGVPANSEMLANLWDVDVSDVKTGAKILVDKCLLQVVGQDYRLHDLILEYLQMAVKMDDSLVRLASSRQARMLARTDVLRRYSTGGEVISSCGIYSLVALWNATKKLDQDLTVGEYYRNTLEGVVEVKDWSDAGRLLEILGDYSEAGTLYARAVAIQEQTGRDNLYTAPSLGNLAGLLKKQGKYSEALPLYKHAIECNIKLLGHDHPDVATYMNDLAVFLKAQGVYGEAESLYKRSLAIYEKTLGGDHPDVASTLNNLAVLFRTQGRCGEAEPLYRRSLAIREEVLGLDHPDVASSLNNLTGLLLSQGNHDEAEALFRRATSILEQRLGHDHPDCASILNNLAVLLKIQGKNNDAKPLYERALAIRERTLGHDHPDVASSLTNLAGFLTKTGKYDDAKPLYQRTLAIREQTLGLDHRDTVLSRKNMASFLREQIR